MKDMLQMCYVAFLVSDALYKIARDEGILGLWSGSMPSFVLSLNPAVQFMVYEALKRRLQKYAHSQARMHLTAPIFSHGTHLLLLPSAMI